MFGFNAIGHWALGQVQDETGLITSIPAGQGSFTTTWETATSQVQYPFDFATYTTTYETVTGQIQEPVGFGTYSLTPETVNFIQSAFFGSYQWTGQPATFQVQEPAGFGSFGIVWQNQLGLGRTELHGQIINNPTTPNYPNYVQVTAALPTVVTYGTIGAQPLGLQLF